MPFSLLVFTDSRHNEADITLLGRIGISILFSYYRTQQWPKVLNRVGLLDLWLKILIWKNEDTVF